MNKLISIFILSSLLSCTKQQLTFSSSNLESIQKTKSVLDKDLSLILEDVHLLSKKCELIYDSFSLPEAATEKQRFKFAKNGSYYTPTLTDQPDAWLAKKYSKSKLAQNVAHSSVIINPTLKDLIQKNPMIVQSYYNSKESFNRIYPPINAVVQYDANIEIPKFNFYFLADEKNNPSKQPTWVHEPYVDPAGNGWMVSAISPVYHKDQLMGVAGLDITLNKIEQKIEPTDSLYFMLIHKNGTIISISDSLARLFDLPELKNHLYVDTVKSDSFKPDQYNVLKHSNSKIRDLFKIVVANKDYSQVGAPTEKHSIYSIFLDNVPWVLVAIKELR